MRKLVTFPLALALTGCSFTSGSGFHECDQTSDCATGRVCQQNFCVSVNCTEHYGSDAGDAIVFGAAIPFTDATGVVDQSERVDFQAAVLALDEVNQPGRSARPISLFACDTQGDQTQLTNELNYLIEQKGAVAILTSQSSQTLGAVATTVPAKALLMTATSTATEIASTPASAPLPDGGTVRMLWRTAPSDSIQGAVIANKIVNNPPLPDGGTEPYLTGINKVGILYVNDAYGQGLFEVISGAIGSAKSVTGVQFTRGADPTGALNSLAAFAPDLTVLIGFPDDLVRILNLADTIAPLRAADGAKWFFTDAAKDPALLTIANPAQIEGALGSNPAQGAGVAFQSFSDRFKAAFGTDPTAYSFTGHSYDAMYLLALGAAWSMGPAPSTGAVTGPSIADGLTHVSSGTPYQLTPTNFTAAATALESHQDIDVQGASGDLTFDPATGEAPSPIQLWQVQSGQINNIGVVNPP